MTRESIKSKIAALLAKAEGTDNAFEAESFMAKVNELLEKHQIEMYEIRAAQGDKDPMGRQNGEVNLYASIKWARDVAGSLAHYYGCRFIFWRQGNHFRYEVVGRESARMTFELMLPFVISQAKQQARRLFIEKGYHTQAVWEREVGQALFLRIHRLIPKAEEHRGELTGKGLIPVSDVEAAMDEFFPDRKKGRTVRLSFGEAARQAAERVSIHHQATGKHTKLLS